MPSGRPPVGVVRTVSRGTDKCPARGNRVAPACRSGYLPSAHGPAQLRRRRSAGRRLAARDHLRRRRPRDHRRARQRRGPRRHHRDRGGQGARRRGARRAGDPRRPRPQHPAADRRADRHHLGDGVQRADHRLGAAGVPRVLPRRGARRPQRRASTSGSCGRPPNAARSPGRGRRCCARSGWPAGCSPATRRPACGWPRWPDCSARRPRRRTVHSTTRAPPSTCCTG